MSEQKEVLVKPQDVIPAHWKGITVSSWDDIAYLGEPNIRLLIRYWRDEAKNFGKRIRFHQTLMDVMAGKTSREIRIAARRYENPSFPEVVVGLGMQVPIDRDSQRRQPGATTFNVCGWCKYSYAGTLKYECRLEGFCAFETHSGICHRWHKFYSNCVWRTASDEDFVMMQIGLRTSRDDLVQEKKKVDQIIATLVELSRTAEKKPPFPTYRGFDWFKPKQSIVYYAGALGWQAAAVLAPDDEDLTQIWVNLGKSPTIRGVPYRSATAALFEVRRPELLYYWEFEYLVDHPQYAELWLGTIPQDLSVFDLTSYAAGMKYDSTPSRGQTSG